MEKPYLLVEKDDRRGWASLLAKNGQALLVPRLNRGIAALLMTERSFWKIMGYRNLWMLKAALDENVVSPQPAVA